MKIAVYNLCLNEKKHIDRYVAAHKEADGIFITDTGSTDGSQEMLRSRGVHVQQVRMEPFRFDAARNMALKFIPEDYDVCLSLDLDECMQPGWRAKVEAAWKDGVVKLNHPIICSFKADGITPDATFTAERIHARHGFEWRHACHEVTQWIGEPSKFKVDWIDATLEHHPDVSIPRGPRYLPLLRLMAKEEPESDRAAHYLGRELCFAGLKDEAIAEFKRHLTLKTSIWDAERASSMRYIAQMMNQPAEQQDRISWLLRACAEAPRYREPWVELAQAYFDASDFVGCYFAADKALSITHRLSYHNTKESMWREWPHDLKGCAAFRIGLHMVSLAETQKAHALAPQDERIKANLEMIGQKVAKDLRETLPQLKIA